VLCTLDEVDSKSSFATGGQEVIPDDMGVFVGIRKMDLMYYFIFITTG